MTTDSKTIVWHEPTDKHVVLDHPSQIGDSIGQRSGLEAGTMRVALISIGHCPSLATRNLRRYCLAHEDVRGRAEFVLFDRDVREFLESRVKSTQRWSFATCADELLSGLLKLRPAIVAFSCYLWNTELSIHLASQIKRLLPRTQIVLGGPDVGPRAKALLEHSPEVDVIIDGDGEVPFLALVRQHLAGVPWALASVPRASYRDGSSVVRSLAPAGSLDPSLLHGVYDELPAATELSRWPWPYILYETMRGCPYQCSYCMYSKIPANRKDVTVVVEELAAILSRGFTVDLIDPTFTTYAKRAKAILRGLAERPYDGKLWFQAFPDSIDEEIVELAKKTNVSWVGIGFQTLSSDGLKAVSRPQNLARFERAIGLLRDAGVPYYIDVIYGLPGTTVDDFVATMDYLHEQGVYSITVYRLLGLPGSTMMGDIETYGLVFSPTPPYELLSSRSFSLDDILLCERFRDTYHQLQGLLGQELLRRFSRMVGSLSALVGIVMQSQALQQDDVVEPLNRVLVGVMRGETADGKSAWMRPAPQQGVEELHRGVTV